MFLKKFGYERFLMNEGGAGGAGAGGAGGAAGGANSGGGAGATPPATPPVTPPATPPSTGDWTSGLDDDYKNYVNTKGFKDPKMALESYRNLEKLIGKKESLLTIPDKDDDKAGWDNIYNRLGRPADPKEYKFELSADAATPEFNDWVRSAMHELGITKKQGETLMSKYGEFFGQEVAKTQAEMEKISEGQVKALQKEWGKAFDQNIQVARTAATAFGFDAGKIDALESALGYDGVMKFLNDLGTKIGTHQFVGGGNGGNGGAMTPTQAQARIRELKSDPSFTKRYTGGDLEAKKEMERLHTFAYPTDN